MGMSAGQGIVWAAVFVCLTALALAPAWLRHRTRIATLELVGQAIASGQTLDPAVTAHLAATSRSNISRWFTLACLFCGVPGLTLGIGAGFAAGLFSGPLGFDAATRTSLLIPAIYGGSAGLGLTALGLLCLRLFPDHREL
jgi:hypothetical protein